ncbi:cyclophilin-like fold protein [Cricetibacter osteomyelitidis]|uniref:cyclophilin-like fold protein n=1 Tax=Cricetibacter osteomyelitidis TaxID=1521931 RepID=UPI001A9E63DC|nr:cyclophilin-like fold protein [Cricetibacter osteomyelitidis]
MSALNAANAQPHPNTEANQMNTQIHITVNNQTFTADLENNAASRALIQKMPFTVEMQNLYGRELVHRLGAGSLPSENLRRDHFAVGDLIYWPPRGSLVILYKQDGDTFERQQLGHIRQDVSELGKQSSIKATFSVKS